MQTHPHIVSCKPTQYVFCFTNPFFDGSNNKVFVSSVLTAQGAEHEVHEINGVKYAGRRTLPHRILTSIPMIEMNRSFLDRFDSWQKDMQGRMERYRIELEQKGQEFAKMGRFQRFFQKERVKELTTSLAQCPSKEDTSCSIVSFSLPDFSEDMTIEALMGMRAVMVGTEPDLTYMGAFPVTFSRHSPLNEIVIEWSVDMVYLPTPRIR